LKGNRKRKNMEKRGEKGVKGGGEKREKGTTNQKRGRGTNVPWSYDKEESNSGKKVNEKWEEGREGERNPQQGILFWSESRSLLREEGGSSKGGGRKD